MDNLHGNLRIAQVAGMWLADGHVTVKYIPAGTKKRQKTASISPDAGYTSKDYDYIEFISEVLTENGIGHYIHDRKRYSKNQAPQWAINVRGHKRFRKWIEVFEPYLMGRKLHIAQALRDVWNPDAAYQGAGRRKTEEQREKELAVVALVRRLNSTGPSETIMVESA